MIAFLDEHRDQFGVEAICRALRATEHGLITPCGYRAAKQQRPTSALAVREEILLEDIRGFTRGTAGSTGVRKVDHAMRRAA
ncbi:IS3-like element IS3501 family transposase, partial [Micrococcus luteus]